MSTTCTLRAAKIITPRSDWAPYPQTTKFMVASKLPSSLTRPDSSVKLARWLMRTPTSWLAKNFPHP